MPVDITIVDYGMGNILSVQRAFEHCGATVCLTSDSNEIQKANRLLLPGVGAFPNAMHELNTRHLVDSIRAFAGSHRPLLGICLGMQLLMDESSEFGKHQGLGIIPGKVVKIPDTSQDGAELKTPHIGWSDIVPTEQSQKTSICHSQDEPACVYFVHSYHAVPDDPTNLIATTNYGGHDIAAIIGKDNFFGCQFHPEKSGPEGLAILASFLAL